MTAVSHLERFVPGHVLARLERDDGLVTEVEGTLCFIDISGFTALSERLAAKGRVGAEELTEVLTRVFGDMLDLVADRGGTLLKFGGDALLLLFEGPEHAMQAACAAVEMRAALRRATEIPTSVGRVPLRMSVGLHSGSVHLFRLSGTHRELIVAGPASTHVNQMEGTADAGEILVSTATRDLLPSGAASTPKGDGWMLRWRSSKAAACGVPLHFDDGVEEPQDYVPMALRAHLEAGVPESEHRLATVVFVKVLGIDDHIADVGAEVTARALQELIANVTAIADEQEVTFLASDVDANAFKIILVAGVPVTSLDENGKALRTARAIADLMTPFDLKLGVNRGHVFSGEVGTAQRSTYTIMGDTVNLAARLMAAAPSGSIYASPEVVNGSTTLFASESVEPFAVKGKSELVHALALGEETGTRTARETVTVPFVGRDDELAILRRAAAGVEGGAGSALAVTGPTGIGKTRTVAEALDGSALDIVEVRSEPYGAANPYRPFRDPVRALLGIERDTNEAMANRLLEAVEEIEPSLVPLAPLLGDIVQVDVPPTEASAAIDPRFRQERAIDVFIDVLAAAHPEPLVVVGEDMHWADAASEALIARLAKEAQRHGWLIIQTCRNRIDQKQVETIWLDALDPDSTRTLVHVATEAAPLRPDVDAEIVTRSGGNPLFALELVKVARDTGEVESLPTSLDGVVGSQIDRLEPLPRRVLGYLSVLGRSFRTAVARQLLDSQGVALDEATRERLAEFLDEDGSDRLQFRHALVRDTAYEGLPYRRRRALHLRAGEMILDGIVGPKDAFADILGLHFFLGGDAERAWVYCRIAGDRNMERYANPEAATQFERALAVGSRVEAASDADLVELYVKLGDVRERSGDFEGSLDVYRKAARLSEGDPVVRASVILKRSRAKERAGAYSAALADATRARSALDGVHSEDAASLLGHIVGYQALIRQAQQRPRQALEAALEAASIAEAEGDEVALARAWRIMDWAYFMIGEPERAIYSERALEVYRRIGDLDEEAGVSTNIGGFAYFAGDWQRALEFYEAGREASQRVGNVVDAGIAAGNIGEVLVDQGRYEEAEAPLEEARRVYVASGFSEGVAFTDLLLGRMHGIAGEIDAATQALSAAIDQARELGLDGFEFEASIHLADATCRAGDPGAALVMLEEASAKAPDDYVDYYASLFARTHGSILASAGRTAEAVEVLRSGATTADERGERFGWALLELTLDRVRPGSVDDSELSAAREALRTLGVRSAPGIDVAE